MEPLRQHQQVVGPRNGRGFLASVLGATVGAAVLGVGGGFLGFFIAGESDSEGSGGFEELFGDLFGIIVFAILMAIVGIWIGATVGCWLGLRIAGHQRQGRSALFLAALLPLWVVGLVAVLNGLFSDVPEALGWIGLGATAVVPPIAARSLALRGAA